MSYCLFVCICFVFFDCLFAILAEVHLEPGVILYLCLYFLYLFDCLFVILALGVEEEGEQVKHDVSCLPLFLCVCVSNSICFLFFSFIFFKHILLKTSPGSGAGKDDENHKEEWSRNLQIIIL